MSDKFVKTYKYSKGIYEANFYDPATRDLIYHDSKLSEANVTSSVNLGEIVAGLGNAVQMFIPDSTRFNIAMTAFDIELRQFELQTGGTITQNGVTMTCEIHENVTGNTITLDRTAQAPYGSNMKVAYVNGDGVAYPVSAGNTVTGFPVAADGKYSVRYYASEAAYEALDIKSLFTPRIVSCELKLPIYSAPTAGQANSGTLYGYLWVIVPRFQFNGEANLASNQTGNVTPSLSGQAIAFDEIDETDCGASSLSSLIYMVWEPIDTVSDIVDIAVIGGGLALSAGATATVPIKYIMKNGNLAQPDFTDFEYEIGSASVATVSAAGIITAVGAGDTDITATNEALGLTATIPVTVTA